MEILKKVTLKTDPVGQVANRALPVTGLVQRIRETSECWGLMSNHR